MSKARHVGGPCFLFNAVSPKQVVRLTLYAVIGCDSVSKQGQPGVSLLPDCRHSKFCGLQT